MDIINPHLEGRSSTNFFNEDKNIEHEKRSKKERRKTRPLHQMPDHDQVRLNMVRRLSNDLLPQPFKPPRRRPGVDLGIPDVDVPEVVLGQPHVPAAVRQREPAGVAQHVRVNVV